ncbi:hypothetical protein Gotri_001248 [Gossypium trilobum]|uniref:Uncharacterized protein n=1 Tax=Gossypium trilobum TaxID=34281 RepID=A0A7J9FED9_9ROSI|nr:hypothetical protein [Gossypium trilobum]
MESRLQEFKTEFRGDLQSLLVQYFRPPPTGSSVNAAVVKGKGGFGSSSWVRNPFYEAGVSTKTSRLECPKFDGNDFREWWTKLE